MTTTPAMPERLTKKPVTIEAVQFTEALRDSIVLDGVPCPEGVKRGATTWRQKDRKVWRADFFIDTLEGRMNVEIGDWIIKGVKGEFYPCKPDIFEMTYDLATLQAQPAAAGVSDAEIARAVRPLYADDAAAEMGLPDDIKTARAILTLRPQSYPLPDDLYDSKDWRQGDYASRVEWLHTMYEHAKHERDEYAAQLEALRPQAVPMTDGQIKAALPQEPSEHERTTHDG